MNPVHRGLYVRWCQSSRVELVIGVDEKPSDSSFLIPREFLQRRSRVLRGLIEPHDETIISLPDTTAQTLTEFFIWSHNRLPQLDDSLTFDEIVDLGIFAWKYQIPALSNQVTDRIRANLASSEWHLPATVVNAIYQATEVDSPLREVIKAALGQLSRPSMGGEEWEKTFRNNSEFGLDFFRAGDKEWARQDYLTGVCRFHNHDGIKRQEGLCDGCPYAEADCYPVWEDDAKQETGVEQELVPDATATKADEKSPVAVEKSLVATEKPLVAVENPPAAVEKAPLAVEKAPLVVEKAPLVVEKAPLVVEKPRQAVEQPPLAFEKHHLVKPEYPPLAPKKAPVTKPPPPGVWAFPGEPAAKESRAVKDNVSPAAKVIPAKTPEPASEVEEEAAEDEPESWEVSAEYEDAMEEVNGTATPHANGFSTSAVADEAPSESLDSSDRENVVAHKVNGGEKKLGQVIVKEVPESPKLSKNQKKKRARKMSVHQGPGNEYRPGEMDLNKNTPVKVNGHEHRSGEMDSNKQIQGKGTN